MLLAVRTLNIQFVARSILALISIFEPKMERAPRESRRASGKSPTGGSAVAQVKPLGSSLHSRTHILRGERLTAR